MAGNLWGADVAQLRTLARQFGKASETLLQQSTQLTNQLNGNASWKGQDALTFRSDWNGTHRMLLQQAALTLKQESRKLLENANEQEKASNAGPGSGGGPVPGGTGSSGDSDSKGKPVQLGPDWLSNSGSPFRDGWDKYNLVKAFPNLRAGIFDLAHFIPKADSLKEFLFSKDSRTEAKAFQDTNPFSKYFNTSSDLFDAKLDKAFSLAEGGKTAKYFDFGGKFLGGLGVGLDTLDAVNNFANGNKEDNGEAYYSATKAVLGAVSLRPHLWEQQRWLRPAGWPSTTTFQR